MKKTPEYQSWLNMRSRCRNPKHRHYADYGGRGITVCARWDSFAQFLADMGPRPTPEHTLDRYPDHDGNYEPGNCRWATKIEQTRNRRNTRRLNGETIQELADRHGLSYYTAEKRFETGVPMDQPLQHKRVQYTVGGEQITMREAAQRSNVSYNTLYYRVKVRGLSLEQAIALR